MGLCWIFASPSHTPFRVRNPKTGSSQGWAYQTANETTGSLVKIHDLPVPRHVRNVSLVRVVPNPPTHVTVQSSLHNCHGEKRPGNFMGKKFSSCQMEVCTHMTYQIKYIPSPIMETVGKAWRRTFTADKPPSHFCKAAARRKCGRQ